MQFLEKPGTHKLVKCIYLHYKHLHESESHEIIVIRSLLGNRNSKRQ